MTKKIASILLLLGCLMLTQQLFAQDKFQLDSVYIDGLRHKEIMVNMTPLISQFVPFNASTISDENMFDLQYRRLKNGKGIRMGLGVNLSSLAIDSDEPQFLFFRTGFVRRKQLGSKWHYSRTFDFNLLINSDGGFGSSGSFGVSYSLAIEYALTKQVTFSTETSLLLNLLGDQQLVKIIPPVGLFLHVRFK